MPHLFFALQVAANEKMEITIFELITRYGFNTVIIAILIVIATGLFKIPIKGVAKKMKDGTLLTKYITFLPIIFGFAITAMYFLIFKHNITFDGNFISLWLTSSSLSLAIYAFKEKFLPSKKQLLSQLEIEKNREMIDKIRETTCIEPKAPIDKEENEIQIPKQAEEGSALPQKIILRGKSNEQTDTKE